jgi:hypothetical protein
MDFGEIERHLGADVVAAVQAAITRAYVASRSGSTADSEQALEELILAMLASVIQPSKDVAAAMRCIELLRSAIADIKDQLSPTSL